MLKIKFKTNNAAFTNENTGESSQEHKRIECSRILRRLADQLENGTLQKSRFSVSQCCVDYNGNYVGEMRLTNR